jgi:hypothetical protein
MTVCGTSVQTGTNSKQYNQLSAQLKDFPIAAAARSDPQLMQGGSPSNGAAAGTIGLRNGLNCGTVDLTAVANIILTVV